MDFKLPGGGWERNVWADQVIRLTFCFCSAIYKFPSACPLSFNYLCGSCGKCTWDTECKVSLSLSSSCPLDISKEENETSLLFSSIKCLASECSQEQCNLSTQVTLSWSPSRMSFNGFPYKRQISCGQSGVCAKYSSLHNECK